MKTTTLLISTILLLLITSTESIAQKEWSPLRIESEIELDGIPNEAVWDSAAPVPLMMYFPVHGGKWEDSTIIKIIYDKHYLYASCVFMSVDPSKIRANTLYRDGNSFDDTFDLIIDSFNDKENGLNFYTTPAGVRGDVAMSNNGMSADRSWNTYWDGKSVLLDSGWTSEIRIPFSSLGFQTDKKEVKIGLITLRYDAVGDKLIVYPHIPSNFHYSQPSCAQEITLYDIESKNPIHVTPYVTGGFDRSSVLNETNTRYNSEDTFEKDLGLDLKYNIMNNLTLDLTINTDFAQVEADNQEVNLTRYSLFYPEKRQFFLERSSIFTFRTSPIQYDRIFHSRRIGIHQGQEVRILGGARLVGKVGDFDIGFINMQSEDTDLLPTTNYGVFRTKKKIINDRSYVGGIATTKIDKDNHNIVYGLDGLVYLNDDTYLDLKFAQSLDSQIDELKNTTFSNTSSSYAMIQRRVFEGLRYSFSAFRNGEYYNPALGYLALRNLHGYSGLLEYTHRFDANSPFRLYSPLVVSDWIYRNTDNSVESARIDLNASLYWKTGQNISLTIRNHYEDVRSTLFFPGDITIPVGSYTTHKAEIGYMSPSGNLFRFDNMIGAGQFYDGMIYEENISATWNLSKHFECNFDYVYNHLNFEDRNQQSNIHLLRLRLFAALNAQVSLNSFIQYDTESDVVGFNARFRYNFAEGQDLWIVFNQSVNTERYERHPVLPYTNNQTILCKYTHTFHF